MNTWLGRIIGVSLCLILLAKSTALAQIAPAKETIAAAQKLLAAGKGEGAKLLGDAIAGYEEHLKKNANDGALLYEIAELQFELQRDEEAAKSIEKFLALKADERIYHLDWYQGREHRTYSLFPIKRPTYEETRAAFIEIAEGKTKAVSGSTQPEKKE